MIIGTPITVATTTTEENWAMFASRNAAESWADGRCEQPHALTLRSTRTLAIRSVTFSRAMV
jgi:hypothetical protein